MKNAPSTTELELGTGRMISKVEKRITGRRRQKQAALIVGLIAALGLGGASVAIATAPPTYVHLDGVARAAYADQLANCITTAGWKTTVLSNAAAAPVLGDLDRADRRIVRTRVTSDNEPRLGRAISVCQTQIASSAGVPTIMNP